MFNYDFLFPLSTSFSSEKNKWKKILKYLLKFNNTKK